MRKAIFLLGVFMFSASVNANEVNERENELIDCHASACWAIDWVDNVSIAPLELSELEELYEFFYTACEEDNN